MRKLGKILKEWGKYNMRKIYMGSITAIILGVLTLGFYVFNEGTRDRVNNKVNNTIKNTVNKSSEEIKARKNNEVIDSNNAELKKENEDEAESRDDEKEIDEENE